MSDLVDGSPEMGETPMNRTSRHRRLRGLRPLGALASLAIIAAACGSSSGSSSGTTAAAPATTAAAAGTTAAAAGTTAAAPGTTAAAPGTTSGGGSGPATGTPVTVAVLADETGVSATPTIKVVKALADDINKNGGLNGHPIQLAAQDLKSDVATAQSAVQKIPSDAIAVILGSAVSEASIAPALSKLNIPVLGVGYQPPVWGGDITTFKLVCPASKNNCAAPNFFTTASTIETTIGDQLVAAKNVGAKKVSAIVCAEVDSCSAAIPIFTAIAKNLGLEVAPQIKVSSTAPDYSAQCVAMMQQGVDYIQLSGSSTLGVNVMKSCTDQGYKGTFGASAGSVRQELLNAPGQLAGGLNGFPWFVDNPEAQKYVALMKAAGLAPADYATPTSTAQYTNLMLLAKEINDHADKSAPLDRAAALAAMYQTKDETLGGLIAQARTFTKDNLNRTNQCFWPYIKKADGTLTQPVGGLTVQCYPPLASSGTGSTPATTTS
jgi:branched-chain amino acid transport system substrate-binding protein